MKDDEIMTGTPILEHHGDETHLLREVYRTNQAMFNNVSRITGISTSRVALVRLLAIEMPQGGGIMEIARKLGINAAAVTRLVKELEEHKWVKRRSDSADARRTHISLTAKGQRRVREIHARLHLLERSLEEKIGRQDIETTVRVLAEMRAALAEFK